MKTLAFLFALFIGFVFNASSQGLTRVGGGGYRSIPTVRFPMKGVDPASAKFTSIFADVSILEAKQRSRPSVVRIAQTLSPGLFLAEINSSKTVALTLSGREYADGTELTIPVENTGRLHTYETVVGSNATVAIYKLKNPQEKFTRERFIASLVAGETYSIQRGTGDEKKVLQVVWE